MTFQTTSTPAIEATKQSPKERKSRVMLSKEQL
jgi:hypothetical protein